MSGDIDHISPFNGNLTLAIPIASYRVSPLVEYSFSVVYNSTFWEFNTVYVNDAPNGVCDDGLGEPCPKTKASPTQTANAGVGWTFSLGRLYTPSDPRVDEIGWLYESPAGSRHAFGGTSASTLLYSRDSSRLRFRAVGSYRVIDFPNGAQSWFEPDGARWRLKKMTDPHKDGTGADLNWVNVAYGTDAAGVTTWTVTDSASRSHSIRFTDRSYDGDLRPSLAEIELATFDGTATWLFGYSSSMPTVARPCTALDGTYEIAENVFVPLLETIQPPLGNGYRFAYDAGMEPTCDEWTGQVASVRLPTLGKIEFAWGRYQMPLSSAAESYLQQSQGVTTRTAYEPRWDEATGWGDRMVGQWSYATTLDRPYDSYGDTPRESTTTVTAPNLNETSYYFNVLPVMSGGITGRPSEYGLPYSPLKTDGAGRYQSRAVKHDGTTVLTEFVRYEMDAATDGTPNNERNARVASTRVRYDQDGGKFLDTDRTGFDGYGNYATTTVSGSFGSTRVSTSDYLPPTGSLWMVGRPSSTSVSEGGVTSSQLFCYDETTGALTRRRAVANLVQNTDETVDPPPASDVIDVFAYDATSRGNVASQKTYGGDGGTLPSTELCSLDLGVLGTPAVHLKHTYSAGTLESSVYAHPATGVSLPFKSVDNDVDLSTGLIRVTRDTAESATTLDYDHLGRLESVTPPGETAESFDYGDASLEADGAFTPSTVTRSRGNETRAVDSYDPFGRLIRQRRLMPDGTWSIRGQAYNPDGTLSWSSGFETLPANTSDLSFNPAHKTIYSDYDALRRARRVTGPDGAVTQTAYTGDGVREVTVTQAVTPSEERVRTETYDHHGRLIEVSEAGSADTAYGYDVGGRLSSVQMTDTDAVVQSRTFDYDGRGFLRSEQHPESGTSEYRYDARGRMIERRHRNAAGQAVTDAKFEYDAAERTEFVKDAAGQILKRFVYGTTGAWKGRLQRSERHNRHPSLGDLVVTDTYEYHVATGRPKSKTTEVTGRSALKTELTYDTAGELWKVKYPSCITCLPDAPPREIVNGYARGYLTSVNDGHESSATLAYHPTGMVKSVTRKLGSVTGPVWTQNEDSATGLPRPASITVTGFCSNFVWQSHPLSTTATSGSTVSLSASATGATSYQWFERIGGVDTQLDGSTGQTLNVTVSSTRHFFVRARSGSCSSDSELATVSVTACAQPDATLSANATEIEPSQQFQASVVDAGSGATYLWTVTNGTILSGNGSPAIQIQAGCLGSVGVSVTVEHTACQLEDSDSLQVAISPPVVTITSAPQTIPVNDDASASIAPITGASYQWTIVNGTITSADDGTSVQFSSSCEDVELTVTATLGCGAWDSKTITIPVTGAPTASVAGTTTILQGETATLALNLTGTGEWTVGWTDDTTTTTPPSSRSDTPLRTTRYELSYVTDANCTRPASGSVLVTVIPPAPANLTATVAGSGSVQLDWSFPGLLADRYRVERRAAGGGFVTIAETIGTTYLDSAVAPDSAYLYRIRAVTQSPDGSSLSDPSAADLATTISFVDDPLTADVLVKAVHLTQLRAAANATRALAGIPPASFTDPDPSGVFVAVAHILELRTAVSQARAALGLTPWNFSDPGLTSGSPIRVIHFDELRGGVR